MKYLKLFEDKEIININNGEVLKINNDIFNKLSIKKIIKWDKEIGYNVYDNEFSSLIKDYIEKFKPEVKPKIEKIKKVRLSGQEILVGRYYYCKLQYPSSKIVRGVTCFTNDTEWKFVKGEKYKVVDTKWVPPEDYVYIKYYKEENKPIKFKMKLDTFNKHFKR